MSAIPAYARQTADLLTRHPAPQQTNAALPSCMYQSADTQVRRSAGEVYYMLSWLGYHGQADHVLAKTTNCVEIYVPGRRLLI